MMSTVQDTSDIDVVADRLVELVAARHDGHDLHQLIAATGAPSTVARTALNRLVTEGVLKIGRYNVVVIGDGAADPLAD